MAISSISLYMNVLNTKNTMLHNVLFKIMMLRDCETMKYGDSAGVERGISILFLSSVSSREAGWNTREAI